MSNPPNRIGGARGPNGSTLDDVVAGLGLLAQGLNNAGLILDGISDRIDITNQYLARLVGETVPANWTGLPNALGVDVTSNGQVPLFTYVQALWDTTATGVLPALSGPAGPRLEEVRAAVAALQGNDLANLSNLAFLLQTQLTLQEQMQLVLGFVEQAPAGSSIKDLLRSIDVNQLRAAECCEEGSTGGGTIPPPPTNCNGRLGTYQQCSLTPIGTGVVGADTYDVYRLLWPASFFEAERMGNVGPVAPGANNGLGSLPDELGQNVANYDVCLATRFVQGGHPLFAAVVQTERANPTNITFAFANTQPFTEDGTFYETFYRGVSPDEPNILVANFAWPQGTAPSGAVWALVLPVEDIG